MGPRRRGNHGSRRCRGSRKLSFRARPLEGCQMCNQALPDERRLADHAKQDPAHSSLRSLYLAAIAYAVCRSRKLRASSEFHLAQVSRDGLRVVAQVRPRWSAKA